LTWKCITVMPVYNEAECIDSVCREWIGHMAAIDGALLVVDDGSKDGSGKILDPLAETEARLIVVHQVNAGHGEAVVTGYRRALDLSPEYIFQVDSDGEMPAARFPEIWGMRDKADVVLGWRTGRDAHPLRMALSNLHRALLGVMFGVQVRDPNIPFRLIRASRLRQLLESVPAGVFAPNVNLALLAAKAGGLALGPEIPMAPRAGGVASIRGWRLLRIGLRCANELARFRINEWRRFQGVLQ